MNVKRYLRLLAIGLLLSLSPSMESYAVCLPDSLSINSGEGMFGDDDQSNPGLGDNDPGGGFTDGDQSNPTMGNSSDDGFSDGDMAGGGSSTPSTGDNEALKPQEIKNVICYTSTDGQIVTPADAEAFGVSLMSNTYANGVGKLSFSGDVTLIGESAFEDCETLQSITLPSGVTDIENFAFSGCTALESILLPASVETFGRYVFADCEALADVTNLSREPQPIAKNVFAVYGMLHVLPGCKEAYEAAAYWKNFTIVEDAVDPNVPTLTDGEAYTLNKDTEVEQLMYRRTFNNTTWQALYVPFSIPVAVLEENGLQVAELNDSHMYDRDDDGVFEEVTIEFLRLTSGSTEANMPYMIRALEAGEKQITLTDVELKTAAEVSIDCSTTKKLFTFTGTYSGVDGETMFANHYYAISGGALKPAANSSVGLKPQRWYMSIENRDGSPMEYNAPSIRLMVNGEWAEEIEEETTGLHTIGQAQPEGKIYTLEGVRVLNASRPGMYVQNGKIVVRK